MTKNKCEVLPDEEDWEFGPATAKLVVGFQEINFQAGYDEVSYQHITNTLDYYGIIIKVIRENIAI